MDKEIKKVPIIENETEQVAGGDGGTVIISRKEKVCPYCGSESIEYSYTEENGKNVYHCTRCRIYFNLF